MTTSPLEERWHSRDFPVLVEYARQLDAGEIDVQSGRIAHTLGLDPSDVLAACEALTPTYLVGTPHRRASGGTFMYVAHGLTDAGRRKVGLWPDEEAASDALVELLEQAAGHVDDEDDQSTLRRAGRLLRTVPAAVLADVTAALIRQQTGL